MHAHSRPSIPLGVLLAAVTAGPLPAATREVSIQSWSLKPQHLSVNQGDTVAWVNKDSASRTLISQDLTWTNVSLGTGQRTSLTFSNTGRFYYHVGVPGVEGSIRVEPNAPVTLGMSSPTNGQWFVAPTNVAVAASAVSHGNATVTRVDLLVDTNQTAAASATTVPYHFTLTNLPAGPHQLTLRAVDNYKSNILSAPVAIILLSRPRLTNWGLTPDGRFGFQIVGLEGATSVVARSANLSSWSSVATNVLPTGPDGFSEPGPLTAPFQFYRVTFAP